MPRPYHARRDVGAPAADLPEAGSPAMAAILVAVILAFLIWTQMPC